jgi:hypothetical protein
MGKILLLAVAIATLTTPVNSSAAETSAGNNSERRVYRTELAYTFDHGESLRSGTRVVDSAGRYRDHGRVTTANGGRLTPVRHRGGRAAGFPDPCTDRGCPRAIISTPNRRALNPGVRPFAFGAQVRVNPNRTAFRSVIIRKGDFPQQGRWRLRIDGDEGVPYCSVAGSAGAVRVRSRIGIANGEWHSLSCARRGRSLRILVDGGVVASRIGPIGAVRSPQPVLIGGVSTGVRNNQFSGSLDNAYLRIRR